LIFIVCLPVLVYPHSVHNINYEFPLPRLFASSFLSASIKMSMAYIHHHLVLGHAADLHNQLSFSPVIIAASIVIMH